MLGPIIGLIISAGLLCLVMYVLAKHEADINFPVVLMISVGCWAINLLLGRLLGVWTALVVFGALAWALQQFCALRWAKAILVTVVYVAASVGLSYVMR